MKLSKFSIYPECGFVLKYKGCEFARTLDENEVSVLINEHATWPEYHCRFRAELTKKDKLDMICFKYSGQWKSITEIQVGLITGLRQEIYPVVGDLWFSVWVYNNDYKPSVGMFDFK